MKSTRFPMGGWLEREILYISVVVYRESPVEYDYVCPGDSRADRFAADVSGRHLGGSSDT
jgi:hypothetical protein